MVPYFSIHSFALGPVTIQVWGLLVALGILAATVLMRRLARAFFLSPEVITDLSLWILAGAFIGARFFHVVFYSPAYYAANPLAILKVWQGGLSSLGGFFGGAVSAWIFVRVRKLSVSEILAYADIASLGLWLGWGIGRIGCFLIHDHPGTLTHFIGGVRYSDGTRHDLGLYESIVGFFIFTIFALLFKRLVKKHWGLVTAFSWMLYALIRFNLDWLRAADLPQSDARYWFLTPAQWGMGFVFLALTGVVIYGIVKWENKAEKKK